MDQMTQKNVAMVEEISAATATLADEAARLREAVSSFKLDGWTAQVSNLRETAAKMAKTTSPQEAHAKKMVTATVGNAEVQADWSEF